MKPRLFPQEGSRLSRRDALKACLAASVGASMLGHPASQASAAPPPSRAKNIVFILIDDLRWDALGLMGHPFLKTPRIDALAQGGVHFANSFVTTSLCSPSRASILTGKCMHHHRVGDNQTEPPAGEAMFPERLQRAGYETAFIGKWHMGAKDDPRPGFDHWVSFRGQGNYFPANGRRLNVNGTHVDQTKYMTDELTDYAVQWLESREGQKPFFLYLSHKGVHGLFEPAPRHLNTYEKAAFPEPETMADTAENDRGKPMWVKNQRNSWHGVDFPYHGRSGQSLAELYRHYCEAILSVDESVGRVMDTLRKQGMEENTLVLFMGDNGFLWGEHGLIDKRCAYEESIRVPLFAYCPSLLRPGTVVRPMVANIDIAPTLLEAAGVGIPPGMDGRSFLRLATGEMKAEAWREYLLYEYYWEYSFPQTPTTFALRGERYKLIQYHGIWDTDELYDLQTDPREKNNLILEEAHQKTVKEMREKLYQALKSSGGLSIPLSHQVGRSLNFRSGTGSKPAEFPPHLVR